MGMTGKDQAADMTIERTTLNRLGSVAIMPAPGECCGYQQAGSQYRYQPEFHEILVFPFEGTGFHGISPSFRYLCGLDHYGISAK
jgi:hypothetical protein